MNAQFLLLALVFGAGPAQPGPPPALAMAGWLGVFPTIKGYQRTFQLPKADNEVWSQSVRYTWTGGRAETIEVTLARDTEFAAKYSEAVYKRLAVTPEKVKVGPYDAWLWPAERLVIFLAKDRTVDVISTTKKFYASNLVKFAEKLPLEEAAKALAKPPRRKFERTVATFAALRKGMSLDDVTAWAGPAEKDIGSGIHIMVYGLPDGTQVLIGFPDFARLIYVKHKNKDGKVTDLVP